MLIAAAQFFFALGLSAPEASAFPGPMPGAFRFQESAQDPSTDADATRQKIDRRIEDFVKSGRRLGSGLLRESISDTLAYGVPVYNSGDREACAQFYQKTVQSLLEAFPEGRPRTPLGTRGLAQLKKALGRAQAAKDPDAKAWAMRFAFDQIMIDWEAAVARTRALVGVGSQNFGGGRYAEAADAFGEAAELLEEIIGAELTQADLAIRGASFMCGHACLALGRWADAARALEAGYAFVPEFPAGAFDLRTQYRADRFEDILSKLKAAREASPEDADLAFLSGYLHFHGGLKDEGRVDFGKALKINPNHPGARHYRRFLPKPPKAQDF